MRIRFIALENYDKYEQFKIYEEYLPNRLYPKDPRWNKGIVKVLKIKTNREAIVEKYKP